MSKVSTMDAYHAVIADRKCLLIMILTVYYGDFFLACVTGWHLSKAIWHSYVCGEINFWGRYSLDTWS